MYFYKSVVGPMTIRYYDGYYYLTIAGETCQRYKSAHALAADVAQFNTGYYPWDKLMYSCPYPLDLSEWDHHK